MNHKEIMWHTRIGWGGTPNSPCGGLLRLNKFIFGKVHISWIKFAFSSLHFLRSVSISDSGKNFHFFCCWEIDKSLYQEVGLFKASQSPHFPNLGEVELFEMLLLLFLLRLSHGWINPRMQPRICGVGHWLNCWPCCFFFYLLSLFSPPRYLFVIGESKWS